MTSGRHSRAFWPPTCLLLGETRIKFSGFAILNISDSTLNCEPREITENQSTPRSLACSLVRGTSSFASKISRSVCDLDAKYSITLERFLGFLLLYHLVKSAKL